MNTVTALSIIIAPRGETLPMPVMSPVWALAENRYTDEGRHHWAHHCARAEMRRAILGLRRAREVKYLRPQDQAWDARQDMLRLEAIRKIWRTRPAGWNMRQRMLARGQRELGNALIK